MYPHERSLVKRYKDRPFAMLGINVKDTQSLLEQLTKDEVVTWKFWVDKPPAYRISTLYNIEGYPTILLLDQRGVIREKDIFDMDVLDGAIEQLVREAEEQKKSS
jgi:hypothetical protein